jgi:SAM-dependent methyltransferase
MRRSLWEWSCDFVGDPGSWTARGLQIVDFLKEAGMTTQSRVLEIGCGNLSQGKQLIEFLAPGHYAGIEPAGWLVEVALGHFPGLEAQSPRFAWGTDFDATSFDMDFDFVLAHSVLSHCAHHQLPQLLANTRKVVDEGAVFLCSYRADQYNSFADEFRYPGHTTFRLQTVMNEGMHAGWSVARADDLKARLVAVAPNDLHDWLKLTAIPSAAALNEFRLMEEREQQREREDKARRDDRLRKVHEEADTS